MSLPVRGAITVITPAKAPADASGTSESFIRGPSRLQSPIPSPKRERVDGDPLAVADRDVAAPGSRAPRARPSSASATSAHERDDHRASRA